MDDRRWNDSFWLRRSEMVTTVLNKAISSHKAKAAREKQCRNANKKALVWIWAHLLPRNVFDFLKIPFPACLRENMPHSSAVSSLSYLCF